MKLADLLTRGVPRPWAEGENIPWNEPEFSRRMLKEHFCQDHDAASRRGPIIDRHVRFLHEQMLASRPGTVLDLGCGPGLYASRMARLGHRVHGIDYSPASITFARQTAQEAGFACTFDLADLRVANYGAAESYDLVMLIYGELNVFRPAQAADILRRAWAALRPGGALVLEPSPDAWIRALGRQPANWYTLESGLFADVPHMMLEESFWDEALRAATNRYYVVELASGQMTRYAASYQAYRDDEYRALVEGAGFRDVRFLPNLTGEDELLKDMQVITARK